MVKRLLIFLFCLQMLFSVEQVFLLPEYYLLKNDDSCGFASENVSDVPTITCPGNITVNNTAGTYGTVTYSVTATALENALFSSVSSNFWTGATRNASFV